MLKKMNDELSFYKLSIIIHIIAGTIHQYKGTIINSTNKRKKYSDCIKELLKDSIVYYHDNILVVNGSHPIIKKLYVDYK